MDRRRPASSTPCSRPPTGTSVDEVSRDPRAADRDAPPPHRGVASRRPRREEAPSALEGLDPRRRQAHSQHGGAPQGGAATRDGGGERAGEEALIDTTMSMGEKPGEEAASAAAARRGRRSRRPGAGAAAPRPHGGLRPPPPASRRGSPRRPRLRGPRPQERQQASAAVAPAIHGRNERRGARGSRWTTSGSERQSSRTRYHRGLAVAMGVLLPLPERQKTLGLETSIEDEGAHQRVARRPSVNIPAEERHGRRQRSDTC